MRVWSPWGFQRPVAAEGCTPQSDGDICNTSTDYTFCDRSLSQAVSSELHNQGRRNMDIVAELPLVGAGRCLQIALYCLQSAKSYYTLNSIVTIVAATAQISHSVYSPNPVLTNGSAICTAHPNHCNGRQS